MRVKTYFAFGLLLVACGARTDLGGLKNDGGSSGACSTPPPAPSKPCTAWQAGTPQVIAPSGSGAQLTDVIATTCGALVAWYTATETSIAWSTRTVDFDGAMLAAPVAHPSLAVQTIASASMSLASDGTNIGALEADSTGCHFMTMDATGHEIASPIDAGELDCRSLAWNGKWTFVRQNANEDIALVTLDGGVTSETPLPLPTQQALWDRVVFPNGSFLLDTFAEDVSTVTDTNWLTPFDANGNSLGPQAVVHGFDSAPVLVVRAGSTALAAWDWTTLQAVPIGLDGNATAPVQTIATDTPIYETSLLPAPNGDVLVTWTLLANNDFTLFARALAPDGTPRGPATTLADGVGEHVVRGAIESTGARAVLAVTMKDGTLEALPLTCVDQ